LAESIEDYSRFDGGRTGGSRNPFDDVAGIVMIVVRGALAIALHCR